MITALLVTLVTLTSVAENPANDVFTAVRNNQVASVVAHVQNGGDINQTDEHGFTALMYATRLQDLTIFDYLIENGANVNQKNEVGATAMFIAVKNGNIHVVARLISAGADLTIKNNMGYTAYDAAQMYNKPMIASLLKRHTQAQLARM